MKIKDESPDFKAGSIRVLIWFEKKSGLKYPGPPSLMCKILTLCLAKWCCLTE
jgi:hypothetical protein